MNSTLPQKSLICSYFITNSEQQGHVLDHPLHNIYECYSILHHVNGTKTPAAHLLC